MKRYSKEYKQKALQLLERNYKGDKPDFSAVSSELGVHSDTLKRWWADYKLAQSKKLRDRIEEAISSMLARIKQLSEESENLSELAPVVKMLSEILQQIEQEESFEAF